MKYHVYKVSFAYVHCLVSRSGDRHYEKVDRMLSLASTVVTVGVTVGVGVGTTVGMTVGVAIDVAVSVTLGVTVGVSPSG